jgi:hypothetical protein
MRSKIALFVSLVFLICTGACAGRQRLQSGLHSELRQPPSAPDPKIESMPAKTKVIAPEVPHAAVEVAAVTAPKKAAPEPVRSHVPKAPRAFVKRTKPPIPSMTLVASGAAQTRPLTPPKVQEPANVAALAALESPDPVTLGVVSSAPPASTEATSSVVHTTNMSARRSSVALADSASPSIGMAVRQHLFEPSASVSAPSPFYRLYLPMIISAMIFGPLLGYILSRRHTRVSSFDDEDAHDVTNTVDTDPAPTHILALAHIVPHPVSTQEARPPHPFPEGSGHIIRSEDVTTGQAAVGEIVGKNPDAPPRAPPTNTIELN